MSANDIQVGGNHYRTEYQHWDWCIDINLGYLESAATKYLSRWRKKNGSQDIKKARHYMTKAADAFKEGRYENLSTLNIKHWDESEQDAGMLNTYRFLNTSDITGIEAHAISACCGWTDELEIRQAIGLIKQIELQVEYGGEPRNLTGWPLWVWPSTGLAVPHGKAWQGMAGKAPTPQGSTNHPSPFGYEGEGE